MLYSTCRIPSCKVPKIQDHAFYRGNVNGDDHGAFGPLTLYVSTCCCGSKRGDLG